MFKCFLNIFLILGLVFLVRAPESDAASSKKLVKEGNMAYLSGEYDQALTAYEEASVDAPESPYIYFNKGAALYMKGDYSSAIESFEKAALKSKDILLEAKSKFNLGNCLFREAERQMDSDLNKSLEACQKSIAYYQESLELDPDLSEAAENIEVVRLVMKNILDEINKQKEAAKQQQEAMEQAAERLKDLIEKQEDALERNTKLEKEGAEKGDSQGLRQRTRDLAGDQKDLEAQTRDLADSISQITGQDIPSSDNKVEQHLENATKEQEAASGNLEQYNRASAMDNQEKALEELNAALESMSQQGQQGQQAEQEEQQGAQQEQQQQASPSEEPEQNNGEQEEEQAFLEQLSEDADDILDEEKENRKQRDIRASDTYKEVDRDW